MKDRSWNMQTIQKVVKQDSYKEWTVTGNTAELSVATMQDKKYRGTLDEVIKQAKEQAQDKIKEGRKEPHEAYVKEFGGEC